MVIYKRIFGLILILLAVLAVSGSATEIANDVSGIWSPDNNPYNVVGDLRVPRESTLIIQPGCYINFTGHYKFIVDTNAILIAEGTEIDSIYFTSEDTIIGWFGLRFLGADTSCRLAYCVLEYGNVPTLSPRPFDNGGAISESFTNLNLNHCLVSNNKVVEGMGGGIYCEHGKLCLQNSEVINNKCSFGGSGLRGSAAEISIDSCTFDNDITYYPLGGDMGGAIALEGCPHIEITNSLITRSFSGQGGGGILIFQSSVTINNNIISNNRSLDVGAGMVITFSTVHLNSNLIFNNRTTMLGFGDGGGLGFMSCQLTMSNNTVVNNYSAGRGGAIWSRQGQTVMKNNIIWGNIDQAGLQIATEQETIAVAEYNDIQNGWPGEGNIDADPLFSDAANGNFHLTWTGFPLDDSGKSPCIDTGDPSSPHDPDTTRADMGAYFFNQHLDNISDQPILPHQFLLLDNYPNPFNSNTIIKYDLPISSAVTLDIYDILGRRVQTLIEGTQPAGEHQVIWKADDIPSGVYFYKLTTGKYSQTKKMILMK